jgi:hypothetical protein
MTRVKLTLAERDIYIMHIENQMELKKKLLLDKNQTLNKNVKYNNILQHIRNDYQKYYDYIIQQKKEQMHALNILNNYIQELTSNGNLSENNIIDAKFEQKKILNEIKSVKNNMEHFLKQISQDDTSNDAYLNNKSINENQQLPLKTV